MDADNIRKDFESRGLSKVEEDLALDRYRSPRKELADLWVAKQKGQSSSEREDKYMAMMVSQLRIAKWAMMAAWVAAMAAIAAMIIA